MKNLHNLSPGIPDLIKLIVTRWHVASREELGRRFGYTKWEDNKLWYKDINGEKWKEVKYRGADNYEGYSSINEDFKYCYQVRTEVGLDCFQEDMLRG